MQPILSKDSAKFPFHQMFGGISRHFFRHVSISKSEGNPIYPPREDLPCGGGAVLHKVKTLQQ